MSQYCRNQSSFYGFGPVDCFQVSDLLAWLEYMAVNWIWLPEFVRFVRYNTTELGDVVPIVNAAAINAGPLMKVTIGAAL